MAPYNPDRWVAGNRSDSGDRQRREALCAEGRVEDGAVVLGSASTQQLGLFVGRVAGGHAWIADRVLLAHDPRALQQLAIDQLKAFRHGRPHLDASSPRSPRGRAMPARGTPIRRPSALFRDAKKMGVDQNSRKTTLTLS